MIPLDANSRHSISVRIFERERVEASRKYKILLLKLDHIGDFVTAFDAFGVIRENFSDAEITLVCSPSCVDLALSTQLFDRVCGFSHIVESNQIGKAFKMGQEDSILQFRTLLEGPYFLAVDLKHEPTGRDLLDLIDTKYRAGFAGATRTGLDVVMPYMEWDIPTRALDAKNLPVLARTRLTALARAIVNEFGVVRPKVSFGPSVRGPNLASLQSLQRDTRLKIGISVGAGSDLRKWSLDYWVDLLARLVKQRDALIVLFGGSGDREASQEIVAKLPIGSCIDFVGNSSLAETAQYIEALSGYIGCDTGLTHLAAYLSIPTVNIFAGVSNVSVWRASGPKVKTVYADVACAPCHLRFRAECPNGNICMTVIVPHIVYACFEQVIAL